MKNINLKRAIISTIIVWLIGIIAFVISYFVPIMANPDEQANWVLSIVLIPAALFGAHIYYRKGYGTKGFVLGGIMFMMTMILDALITVPLFIMPYGGDYKSFFLNPGFWLIAVEYVSVVAAFRQIEKAIMRNV